MALTRADALKQIDGLVAAIVTELDAVRDATNPEDQAAAFGRAVAYVLPLRVAISDGRAGSVVRALDRGASVRGLAARLELSRGMVQQLQHRGRADERNGSEARAEH
jgi:hypothetical protein